MVESQWWKNDRKANFQFGVKREGVTDGVLKSHFSCSLYMGKVTSNEQDGQNMT